MAIIAIQTRVGNTLDFQGFVPDAETAVSVARPIFRKIMGLEYVKLFEPLTAKKVEGRWLVTGRGDGAHKKSKDMIIEPYFMAIDPWSGRIVLFGQPHLMDVSKVLRSIKLDGHPPIKG